ncbi:MAG TPA: NB-ARC domain-containing protein, partial [Candidatus Nitrosotalea sp.]|nr:NB-ARC domain-containing protein [Candidatus Nitrosotalea sp.]
AAGAAAAALAAQRALAAEDFSNVGDLLVRMALHTGTAHEREGDYFGPAVNRVARLLALGHGGQILISGTTADLLQGELTPESSLRDLGAHRLKDLAQPEHVYQLLASDLREAFPALRSLQQLPNNLPMQLTSFVGRDGDLAQIEHLVEEHRLVTLVGSGGAGKTRCAIQAGADRLERYDDGVWLVEFAKISDPSLVPSAIAQALGLRESPSRRLEETIVAHLQPRRALLVFDNCEHVIEAVRSIAAEILQRAPRTSILATSREGLSVAGEHVYRVPSLTSDDAVALFTDRAQASDSRFALTDKNAPFVAEIATRLDGIPLAIELAAARIKVLSPQQLVEKLNERFRVLTGGDRSALPRHQTMRALIDWSYDLLSDAERELFRKLSVFAGGFTLASAAAVCGDAEHDEIFVLDLLASLVDKSLVQSDPGREGRYRLLESTRQYARERLIERGEHETIARAHAEAFLQLAREFEQSYNTMPDREWFAQVEVEFENWRAALDWALNARGDVLLGQRLAAKLAREWAFLLAAEGRRWLLVAQTFANAQTPAEDVAALDLAEAQIDAVLGLHKTSYDAAIRARERYETLGDRLGVAKAQRHAGRSLVFTGKFAEGEPVLREALAVFRESGEQILVAAALENLASARNAEGDLDTARRFYAEALSIFKANGAERLAAALATNLAETEFRAGNVRGALELAAEALATNKAASFTYRTAFLMCNVAAYHAASGEYEAAREAAREALGMARRLHYETAIAWAIQHLAAVAALRRNEDPAAAAADRSRAARLFGYVDSRLAAFEAFREYTEQREY